ncbi:hypothetical protein HJFPF1_10183 [Paramyrothecium foliicola]|nr:hypothetical protein HJFPF1_10183 [Paramyrothecium foliicola]
MGHLGRQMSPDSLSHPADDVVSLSPSSSQRRQTLAHPPRSPGLFSSVNIFRRSSYRRQNSDDLQEMIHLKDDANSPSSPPLTSPPHASSPLDSSRPVSIAGTDALGISTHLRRTSLTRVPVGSKASSPTTPGSQHLPMGSPSPLSSVFMKSPTWDRPSTIHEQEAESGPTDDPNRAGYANLNVDENYAMDQPHYAPVTGVEPSNPDSPNQDLDGDAFAQKFSEPPSYCSSRHSVNVSRASWLTLTIYALSVYSTIMSGIWLVVAILQPRWGHQISSRHGLLPASATLLAALAAKTIEISFVTVFVSCLGQVLSRKSYKKESRGVTLAEMTMRNWVIQPGSLVTHFESLPYAGVTVLGALSLTATIAALLYTTASDAMISPKLKYGGWEFKALSGRVRSSYANVGYIQESCTSVLGGFDNHSAESCMSVQFSGQSYRNLMSFMNTWATLQENDTVVSDDLKQRPVGTMLLFDNTTMTSSWIETEHSKVADQFQQSRRIINNASLSFPNPNIYAAATSPINDILQPDDLGGVGEYSVNAAVLSPTINVLCVNMNRDELAPLIYTEWPHSITNNTGVGKQKIGWSGWETQVPGQDENEFLNSTVVDDVFKWGKKYNRRPPVFQLYPADYNLLTNSTVYFSDAAYMLGKSPKMDDYSLCELRSWMSPSCMTQFNISGTSGANMRAVCEDAWDQSSFHSSSDLDQGPIVPSKDWKWVADSWRLSMDLHGGVYNNNASNARILTQLGLAKAELPSKLPSLAEALAVFASSTIVISALDAPLTKTFWEYGQVQGNILPGPGAIERFDASLATQQYTSGHTAGWQKVFYVILVLVFAINLFCLLYLAMSSGPVTDVTEPQNLFALAINSPPSVQIQGSCGGGPEKRDLVVPWKVSHAASINHYFFEEANERPWRGRYSKQAFSTSRDPGEARNPSYRVSTTASQV